MTKEPDRISIEKSYEKFKDMKADPCFTKMSNKELFLYSLSIGFKNDLKLPISKREAFFTALDLRNDHYTYAIFYSVALYETKDHEVLTDMNKVFKIVEEYANGGYSLILGEIKELQYGEYVKHIEKEVHDEYKKIQESFSETH